MCKSEIFAEKMNNISFKSGVNNKRRESTSIRDNAVHDLYDRIFFFFGELRNAVSKSYIYEKIQKETKLSIRTISFILNHTKRKEIL